MLSLNICNGESYISFGLGMAILHLFPLLYMLNYINVPM